MGSIMRRHGFGNVFRIMVTVAMLLSGNLAPAQVVVIVNPQSGIDKLTTRQIADLYLGKSKALPGGRPVKIINMPESSPLHDRFYSSVTGMNAAQVKSTWSRLLFSGRATPPRELPSAAAVRRFVASNPDAIGYIDHSAVDDTVMVVLSVH